METSVKINLPLIASQEVFYINEDMAEAHDALICVGEKTFVDEANEKNIILIIFLKIMLRLKIYSKIYLKLLKNNQNFPKNLVLSQKKLNQSYQV